MPKQILLALFCKVVDNYGDIGICWRLAKQFTQEHNIKVILWINNLFTFKKICPKISTSLNVQKIFNVTIVHWCDQNKHTFKYINIVDVVIEFFGCQIPSTCITIMATRLPAPIWINLEGLSAEKWIEKCHMLASPHPSLPLVKYFFFPGFTCRTGGLLQECNLEIKRQVFYNNKKLKIKFLQQIGLTKIECNALKISLFCYSYAPILMLFNVWKNSSTEIVCLVPEGIALTAIQEFFQCIVKKNTYQRRGKLTVRVIPFLSQSNYDKLLWSCDINFVRGEDSFVRAQLAQKPFIWHIYRQEKDIHFAKLNAFLNIYIAKTSNLINFTKSWNNIELNINWKILWSNFIKSIPLITLKFIEWNVYIKKNDNFTSNLLKFIKKIQENHKK